MKKLLERSAMFDEACHTKKGFNFIVEILIFAAVFTVASTVESLIITAPLVIWLLTGTDLVNLSVELARELANGGTAENMQGYMDLVQKIMSQMPDWLMILQLFATAAVTVVFILFCRLIQKRKLPSLGFRRGHAALEYLVGAAVGAGMIAASVGINLLVGGMSIETGTVSVGIWILYLVGYILQGMSEEVMCRGCLMVSMARRNPLWVAVLGNSLVFAALHLLNPGVSLLAVVNLFISGCVFSVYVIKRGNIWGACALHSFWNFFQGNVFGVSVSGMKANLSPLIADSLGGMDIWNGESFGLEGGLAVTIVELVTLCVLLFIVPAKKKEMTAEG